MDLKVPSFNFSGSFLPYPDYLAWYRDVTKFSVVLELVDDVLNIPWAENNNTVRSRYTRWVVLYAHRDFLAAFEPIELIFCV